MSRGQRRPRYRRNRERQKDTAKASCRCFSLRSRLDARKKYRCRKLSHSGSQIHRCHDLSAERRRRINGKGRRFESFRRLRSFPFFVAAGRGEAAGCRCAHGAGAPPVCGRYGFPSGMTRKPDAAGLCSPASRCPGGGVPVPGFFVLYIGPSGKVQYRDKLLYLY